MPLIVLVSQDDPSDAVSSTYACVMGTVAALPVRLEVDTPPSKTSVPLGSRTELWWYVPDGREGKLLNVWVAGSYA
jgi:hypothetical protein